MNQVNLIGRLTKDPEVRYTQNNIPVASYTLAVKRSFAKDGEQDTDFINVISWNKSADFVQKYFKKGLQVWASGRIQTRNWEDDNGQKHYATEVVTEKVGFADSKKEEPTDVTAEVYAGDDDMLPF